MIKDGTCQRCNRYSHACYCLEVDAATVIYRTEIEQLQRERDEARAEVALMRQEVESQEIAHREEVARYQANIRHAARAYALEVSRWRPAALQHAASLARLREVIGEYVTAEGMDDPPRREAAWDALVRAQFAGKSTKDGGQSETP